MHMMPHSSPCAPAAGVIATAGMPVSALSQRRQRVDELQRALHRRRRLQRVEVGEAGSRAIFSLRRGLCFMVHEPSG